MIHLDGDDTTILDDVEGYDTAIIRYDDTLRMMVLG